MQLYIQMEDKRVTKYINAVKKRIKNDYGEIPEEWSAQLQQLADLYSCYLKAADMQKEMYVVTEINNGKTECKTVEFQVMLDCVNAMKKVIAEFGLSPRAKAMIKTPQPGETDEFADKFLSD